MTNENEPTPRPTPPANFYGSTDSPPASPRPPHAAVTDETVRLAPLLGPPSPTPAPQKSGRARGAGVVLASMLLGAVAGYGGAATHAALNDDDTGSSGDNGSTSQVIDQGQSSAEAGTVEGVASTVLPSVVRIDVSAGSGSGSGSGIVLTEDGQILTNNHVIDGAGDGDTIRVAFADGSNASARVLGNDPLTDTAVIQAEDVSGLTPATIGKSGNLQVGQQVVAIGSPFGLDATVTSGIVSALDRPVNVGSTGTRGNSTTYPAIQTDAAINPGNSGGPLVDLTGSVVGINSSIRTAGSSTGAAGSIGLGFAIPIDEILPIVDQMKAGEQPTHARLGITVTDATNAGESRSMGALVREVTGGAAAGSAGLEQGDVIIRIDDAMIDGADDLVATVRSYRPSDEVEVTYVRGDDEQTVKITLDSDAE